MNIVALRYFNDVSCSGSMRKSADRMSTSPSTISRHIACLERQFGTPLLQRMAGGVALTAAGERLAQYARVMVLDYDALRTDLNDLRGSGGGLVRLAAIESIISDTPLRAIAASWSGRRGGRFHLESQSAEVVERLVIEGRADIGIAYGAPPNPELHVLGRWEQRTVVAVRADHPLAARKCVDLAELANVRLALHDHGHGVRTTLERACRARGIVLKPDVSSNSLEVLRAFARQGLGASIVTEAGVARRGELVAVPIAGPFVGAEVSLFVLSGRRLSKQLREFAAELHQLMDHVPEEAGRLTA